MGKLYGNTIREHVECLEYCVMTADYPLSMWVKNNLDHVWDQPEIERWKVEDGVHHGRVWFNDVVFIYCYGESWEEVELRGRIRWANICGRPVGV